MRAGDFGSDGNGLCTEGYSRRSYASNAASRFDEIDRGNVRLAFAQIHNSGIMP